MKKLIVIICLIFTALTAAAQYHNPVIPGYHPAPSICRVGGDFYLVNPSSQYFPGIPIYHSTDLVNWELLGNVLDRESQLPLKGATSWTGIFAPTLRYHDGLFYLVSTNVGNGGNFLVTARDPRGPWSDPVWLEQRGIDPSLYFEGRKCYLVSNPDNKIMLCEIDPATGRQLTPSRPLWQGMGMRHPEAPHIYKKDGYYYLLLSEGGTELAHCMTIARSKNIYGPYEGCPRNPILTHCNVKGQDSQIQATGHGDFIQAPDGSWWTVFLAYRHFGINYHHLGRETFLAPVEWKAGQWPVVNGGEPIDTLMKHSPMGAVQRSQKRHIRTTFDQPLGPEWIYIQNPDSANYQRREGWLQLISSHGPLSKNDRPTFVGRRQESPRMVAETFINFDEGLPRDEAGMTVYQYHDGHADLFLRPSNDKTQVAVKMKLKNVESIIATAVIDGYSAYLRIRSDGDNYWFDYSVDGKNYQTLTSVSCTLLSTEVLGGFTGAVIGLYAVENNFSEAYGRSFARFDYFDYLEQ